MVGRHGAFHGERAQVEGGETGSLGNRRRRQCCGEAWTFAGPAKEDDFGVERAELPGLPDLEQWIGRCPRPIDGLVAGEQVESRGSVGEGGGYRLGVAVFALPVDDVSGEAVGLTRLLVRKPLEKARHGFLVFCVTRWEGRRGSGQ